MHALHAKAFFFNEFWHFLIFLSSKMCDFFNKKSLETQYYVYIMNIKTYEGSFNQTDNFFYFITKLRFFKNFNKGYAINFLCSAKIFDINNLISITDQMIN